MEPACPPSADQLAGKFIIHITIIVKKRIYNLPDGSQEFRLAWGKV